MAYSGRLAIIAGGLGGIGSAIGQSLRSRGAHLAILHHPSEAPRKQEVLSSVFGSSNPDGVDTYACDVTSEASVQQAFQDLAKPDVFPSILVNTAGYVIVKPLEQMTMEETAKHFNINLMGPLLTGKAFYNLYTSRVASSSFTPPPGRIISLASQAAHVALDGHGPYCASKAGLIGLTRCMAGEWGKKGITSNTVSPTVVLTALGKAAWADETKRNAHLAQIPVGRFAEPEEIATATEFLCRDESGMINGADIRVDGGFTICK